MFRQLSSDEGYKGWFIHWIEEWSQFRGGCNWYTFHPIQFEIEDDRSMGGVEMTLIVLGLGFRVRWNWRVTDQAADILQAIDDINSGRVDPLKPVQ